MQNSPVYDNAPVEIRKFLYERAGLCEEAGIPGANILVDPGIGFGKTLEHNLQLLGKTDYMSERYPVLIGASRKSFIGTLLDIPVSERMPASVAAACWAAVMGASVVRVHDIKETRQALDIIAAVSEYE
jgi:dihydropteroate synthase